MNKITIIGAGLAGCEAAWQLAERGYKVVLAEMRPSTMTPAHKGGELAELVCSNSLGALNPDSPGGLLKGELQILGSLVIQCALMSRVPAGGALAVDRVRFSRLVTEKISSHPGITLCRERWTDFPPAPGIIATGPLTDAALAQAIRAKLGEEMLFFYDAASPIVDADTIDRGKVFAGSRYGKGGEDYLNCPMNYEEYQRFFNALVEAETVVLKDFEEEYFEHCLPVEELARRGPKTLTFGPLKPVGLTDPRTGSRPHAVVQLRREDVPGSLYNLVGFQTNLTWGEQKRVFRLIPGLERAEFVRYGVMHRNTYVNGPKVLDKNFRLKQFPGLYIAGQLAGVEGYVESTASGLIAALDLWSQLEGRSADFPPETLMGCLSAYVTRPNPDFQPMNANFGLLPPVEGKSKKERRHNYAKRSLEKMKVFAKNFNN
ncbi:MAG: methylenetetrahydrofolate--tRNA-(uracil(54)-C(5))-methyltransferase (FADH(2)-oxidizing) TrmFO [Bacillota bacterium]